MSSPEPTRVVRSVNGNVSPLSSTEGSAVSPILNLGDIYYVLFRHKWKIVLCSLAGLSAAVAFYKLNPQPYESRAKLFIRYVMENRTPGPAGNDARVTSLDRGGDTILNSELEIITSTDLAGEVVDRIGVDKILPKTGSPNDRDRAAGIVARSLTADVPSKSNIILLSYKNANPLIVQPVLREVIACYEKKHKEIHRALGITGDFLTHETDQLRSRLAETEEELRKAKNKIGVSSIEDAKKAYATQITELRQEIFSSEAALAERAVILQEITGKAPTSAEPKKDEPRPTQEIIDSYRQVDSRLAQLRRREQELLTQFTEENSRVKEVRDQIAEVDQNKKTLEAANPSLVSFESPKSSSTLATPSPTFDVSTESARLHALESKIKVLRAQLDQVKNELSNIEQMESSIQELKRKKDLEESNYRYYSASLEQARIDEALGAGHVSNISEIQSPSPASRDQSKSRKVAAMLGAAGIAIGLAWAFAIELFLDRTIKRPIDIERFLKLPLFISIPTVNEATVPQLSGAVSKQKQLTEPKTKIGNEPGAKPESDQSKELASFDQVDALYPFHETLRDRLIAYFESINLTHKPKLLAVTGLARQSGVTTIAAGLAQSLSETGEGNVLLVDMTIGQGSAQQFFKGKAICGLDELLDTRASGHVQENLYVVSEGSSNSDRLSRNLPQRFSKLVPKLKASDFDYIIFDMPPVSQISVTPRLAGLMDMVLLVIESEKTDRDIVERATALLSKSKAHIGTVLNKTRTYIPKQLYHDSLSDI